MIFLCFKVLKIGIKKVGKRYVKCQGLSVFFLKLAMSAMKEKCSNDR